MAHPDMVPLLVIDDLAPTRRFYVDDLGCLPVMEQDGYLQVRFGDDANTRELAFMTPAPADSPMGGASVFSGGLIVSVSVDDADKQHAVLAGRDVEASEPSDKPWGWRSFVVRDPNGVTLDFFHEIADTAPQDASS